MIRLPPTVPCAAGVSFAFESYGRRIGLTLCDRALLEPVAAILPAGWRPVALEAADRRFRLEWLTAADSGVFREGYHLYDGEEFRRWAEDETIAVDGIETEIEHDVAEFAHPWLFMHAGVVAWRGQAIVLPGASHAGKSTLVAALVRDGATYLSDEYAVLDASGRVLPFPRRLSLRDGPLGPAGRLDLRNDDMIDEQMSVPLPIARVAMLRYQESGALHVRALQPGEAIRELCQHMVAIQRRPQDVLATLNRITRHAPVSDGARGEVQEAVEWLLHAGPAPSGIMSERTTSCR